MIGEFHLRNNASGLHNPHFYPLRAPFPSLVIRHMAPTDLVFLKAEMYSPELRIRFLESYIERMAGEKGAKKDDQILEANKGLAAARAEMAARGTSA